MMLVETSKREDVLRSLRPTSYSFLKKMMFSRVKPYTYIGLYYSGVG